LIVSIHALRAEQFIASHRREHHRCRHARVLQSHKRQHHDAGSSSLRWHEDQQRIRRLVFHVAPRADPLVRCRDRVATRTFGKRFGDNAYAMEEMVAELGAAFLCGDLGITAEPRADHAEYIGHWLRILKADSKAIFTAASAANKAAEFLTRLADIEHREAA
jgi:antirestriction protein ArdC